MLVCKNPNHRDGKPVSMKRVKSTRKTEGGNGDLVYRCPKCGFHKSVDPMHMNHSLVYGMAARLGTVN